MKIIKNSFKVRFIGLVLGLVLNALGNGLCISSNMGSGIWTASAVNMHNWLGLDTGILLMLIGLANAITNQILIHQIDIKRFIGQIIFVIFYGYFVDIFTDIFNFLGMPHYNVIFRIFFAILGIVCFCVAISLYQRANILMHPNDDTTNILRFHYLKGNSTLAQLIDFIPPIIIVIIAFVNTHEIYSINIATLVSILFNGVFIATADKYIWPRLKHNFKLNNSVK